VGGPESEPPRLGETGIARPGFDPARIIVQEVVYGREEALRRWLDLDTGARPLAIVTTGPDGLREHTPGELAVARLLHDTDEVRVTRQLADWLHKRSTTTPQSPDLGWSAASACAAATSGTEASRSSTFLMAGRSSPSSRRVRTKSRRVTASMS
jgi:hypothetical protein